MRGRRNLHRIGLGVVAGGALLVLGACQPTGPVEAQVRQMLTPDTAATVETPERDQMLLQERDQVLLQERDRVQLQDQVQTPACDQSCEQARQRERAQLNQPDPATVPGPGAGEPQRLQERERQATVPEAPCTQGCEPDRDQLRERDQQQLRDGTCDQGPVRARDRDGSSG